MEKLWMDLRYAVRQLLKQRGFTVVAVLTLALGIGANTAMFSIINGVLLKPLPYPDAERLVVINNSYPGLGFDVAATSVLTYLDRREGVPAFADSALWQHHNAAIAVGSQPAQHSGARATRTLFTTLQTEPLLGRNFTEDEMQPGRDRAVILSHSLWQELFAGSPSAVGSRLRVDGIVHEVVGVMPPQFTFPDDRTRFWLPYAFTASQMTDDERFNEDSSMLARLAPGAGVEQAREQMQALFARLGDRAPEFKEFIDQARPTTLVKSLHDNYLDGAAQPMLLLQLCVGLVLLIVCANIANLLLARAAQRQRELAVRSALGAARSRITRQMLTECVLLAVLGAGGGVLLAHLALKAFQAFDLAGFSSQFDISVDGSVLLFSLCIALVTGLLFGLVPAVAAQHIRSAEVLKEGSRGNTAGRRAGMFRGALVVTQVTLAVALLVSAGLLLRSFAALQAVDPGFDRRGVLTAQITLPVSRYPDIAAVHSLQQRLAQKLRELPGVDASALAHTVPFGNTKSAGGYAVRGAATSPNMPARIANKREVSPGYFETMGIALRAGRDFSAGDRKDSAPVAIVDDLFARKHFGERSALGEMVTFNIGDDDSVYHTIVGVVDTALDTSLRSEQQQETVYLPIEQSVQPEFQAVLRASGDPQGLIEPLRAALRELDPELPAYDILTLSARVDQSLRAHRTPMTLLGVFAVVALTLAGVGLYGVLSFNVTQRTGEIGVRMALGADRRRIVGLILGQASRLLLAGLGLGATCALLLALGLRSLLFGVSAMDPLVYAGALTLLAVIALLACLFPVLRATRVNPIDAVRYE